MQVTLNKVPFDVRAVDGARRAAVLSDPAVAQGLAREVWAWDAPERKGRFLVPVTEAKALPLPPGVGVLVARPGANGGRLQRAPGPTQKMAERFLQAIGAKGFAQVQQALARVVGAPQRAVPFEAFAAMNALASYRVVLEVEPAVVELSNPSRNLAAFALVPGVVAFRHVMDEVPEGAPAPGSVRPGFVLPPPNQAAATMRRVAMAQRLTELQAALGATKPADLAPDDPRRALVARLGAEWRLLSPKAKAA